MADYTPRLKASYNEVVRPAMKEEFAYKNDMMIPKITKITLNMGIGETVNDSKKIRSAVADMASISGQQPVITKAKKGTLHDRRQVLKMIQDKAVVAKLFEEIGPKYQERNGGYTRITRTTYRKGDGTELAVLELV